MVLYSFTERTIDLPMQKSTIGGGSPEKDHYDRDFKKCC